MEYFAKVMEYFGKVVGVSSLLLKNFFHSCLYMKDYAYLCKQKK
jgi:hypothetical protein